MQNNAIITCTHWPLSIQPRQVQLFSPGCRYVASKLIQKANEGQPLNQISYLKQSKLVHIATETIN